MAVDMTARPNETEYYLGIAEAVAKKSTCLRRKYGAVIVNHGEVVSTGYNGAPRGCVNCTDVGFCVRNLCGTKQGSDYNKCRSVHAEMNAMLSASRQEMLGSTIYIVGLQPNPETGEMEYASSAPCLLCLRMLINAGVKHAYGYMPDIANPSIMVPDWIDISRQIFDTRMYIQYEEIINQLDVPNLEEIKESVRELCNIAPDGDGVSGD